MAWKKSGLLNVKVPCPLVSIYSVFIYTCPWIVPVSTTALLCRKSASAGTFVIAAFLRDTIKWTFCIVCTSQYQDTVLCTDRLLSPLWCVNICSSWPLDCDVAVRTRTVMPAGTLYEVCSRKYQYLLIKPIVMNQGWPVRDAVSHTMLLACGSTNGLSNKFLSTKQLLLQIQF